MSRGRKLAAGNWKMNGTGAELVEIDSLIASHAAPTCEILICPPATLVARMAERAASSAIAVGGQDCHKAVSGAHTGDVSASMLAEAGATYVIVGHSERRTDHRETDAEVRAKAEAAWAAGLSAIVCVGETLAERDAGRALDVAARQVADSVPKGATGANAVVAYEPVWAIGTGKVPKLDEIAEMHGSIRSLLVERHGEEGAEMRILYGGSAKPDNAAEIFGVPNVDGALVGGASLKAADFTRIVAALEAS